MPQKISKVDTKSNYPTLLLFGNIFVLVAIGILMVYQSSIVYAINNFGSKYHFLFLQVGWMTLGLVGMYLISRFSRDLFRRYALIIWIFSIVCLVIVLLPTPFAPEVLGARRWIVLNPEGLLPRVPVLGRINFQPSEFSKLASVIFFSSFITSEKIQKYNNELKRFLVYFGLAFINIGLIALQPNFSTSLILTVVITSIYFFSGGTLKYILYTAPFAIIGIVTYLFSSEYRRARILTLFSPESSDKLESGYHINQIMIALGSGGLFGLGIGRSRQKFDYLPEVTADSIFAVIGEELGFVGAVVIIVLLVGLAWQCFTIASRSGDKFMSALASGVGAWISIQTFINLGAMVRILPITGIPLPLLSYGGSSAIFILLGLGLVINASKYIK